MAKINQINRRGWRHGFWKNNYYFSHHINGYLQGYYEDYNYKRNYKNDKKNGFVLDHKRQYYLKQKKFFGEQLEW